ncbi:class I SAM-dependent methyltransferase [Aeromicrobium choanae]|uniref:Methyltransferase domain-containing protein n=1 Tax=Aeromicrobium choanae TaxID=1736691 RepID=A0A1T4Z6L8_9ACTN|nr:methyltransferase domain-containing protein [Aeromicrobium choanae]SKB09644.1 Methyltransferase domain-containing protein [Aeromicrobium choanae]
MGPIRGVLAWQSVLDALVQAGAAADGSGSLRVLDLGGGTGSDAVRVAALGHRVVVVDPSPDALAASARRAAEAGVDVEGRLGDSTDLAEHVPPASVDLVICHGVLEHVVDPAQAVGAARAVLRPGGWLSVVVAGRVATITARAAAGDFAAARALVDAVPDATWDLDTLGPRRWYLEELEQLLSGQGLTPVVSQGVRVLSDEVPGVVVDGSAGAREELFGLEQTIRRIPQFAGRSAGLQTMARLESTSHP